MLQKPMGDDDSLFLLNYSYDYTASAQNRVSFLSITFSNSQTETLATQRNYPLIILPTVERKILIPVFVIGHVSCYPITPEHSGVVQATSAQTEKHVTGNID